MCLQWNCNYTSPYVLSGFKYRFEEVCSLAWSVSFMLAKHISCNYIKNRSYGDGSFIFFGRGGIVMLKSLEKKIGK